MNPEQIQRHLRRANEVARRAAGMGRHPFGALLVAPDGETVLAEQGNIDTVNHAESTLARHAATTWPGAYLRDCTLVTTFESCAMCASTIYWAGIGRVVYGASEEALLALTGDHEENPTLSLPCREVFARGQRAVEVVGPVEALVTRWWRHIGGSGRRVECGERARAACPGNAERMEQPGNRLRCPWPLSPGCLPPAQAETESPIPMKRASTVQSPLFTSANRWSLEEPPKRRGVAADTHASHDPTPTSESAPVIPASPHEPPPLASAQSREPQQPTLNAWASMPEQVWNNQLVMALIDAKPLTWGDHHKPVIAPYGAIPTPLDTSETPQLFQKLGHLTNIAARIESVLLSAASDPMRFARTLASLVEPAVELIGNSQVDAPQAGRLRRLLMTATAIAYQQGLTHDLPLMKTLAALCARHKGLLWQDDYWVLLSHLETALQNHGEEQGRLLASLRQAREALETSEAVTDFIPRDPRTMTNATLQEKKVCIEALVNQEPPFGPLFIAQLSWSAQHWLEPELSHHIVDGIAAWLLEASKGVQGNGPFQGAFLFELLPDDVLHRAFYLVGGPDNGKLLQVRPLTPKCRALLDHYLQNQDVPETDRHRLRQWHGLQ